MGIASASQLGEAAVALPGARSIVAVALSYFYRPTCVDCGDFTPESPGPRGRVSRFAWGLDYHIVMERKLRTLASWLKEETNCDSLACADTGPMRDRAAAQLSGIGWYGKNCMIIVPSYGSWVVLGELITTADLTPDAPTTIDRCGSCELCMKACPTGAIVKPFMLDANRCISHLTQMKGSAPVELRRMIGDRVYGCDVCQDVCPQNRNALPTMENDFICAVPPGRRPALIPLARMTQEEFKRDISTNTMAWIRRTRLRRNAIVALGNSGSALAAPVLTECLADKDSVIREHAEWALAQIGI